MIMKQKKDYEKYKPENARQSKWDGLNESEEEIMKKIDEISEKIEVPNSLTPENMMKRIQNAKETDKRFAKQEQKNQKKRKLGDQYWNRRILAAGVTAAVVMTAVFAGGIFKKQSVQISGTAGKKTENNSIIQDLKQGEGTTTVLCATSREEIVDYVSDYYVRLYNENQKDYEDDVPKGSYMDGASIVEESQSESGYGVTNGTNTLTGTSDSSATTEENYYQNNDQVEGVVEADTVITNGKYIFAIKDGERVQIISAKNGEVENVSVIRFYEESNIKLGSSSHIILNDSKLFVNENKLVVVFEYNEMVKEEEMEPEDIYSSSCFAGYTEGNSYTVIMQYDIADAKNPVFESIHKIDGTLEASRMTDGYVYLLTSKRIQTNFMQEETLTEGMKRIEEDCIPKIDEIEIPYENICVADEGEDAYGYSVLSAFQIKDDGIEDGLYLTDSQAVLSDAYEIYVSAKNIYTMSETYAGEETHETDEYGRAITTKTATTKIYRFSYEEGEIVPCAVGVIRGCVLNQFSLDEYDGYLRLVANVDEQKFVEENIEGVGGYSSYVTNATYNAVYVLDKNMGVYSSIEDIAHGEDIYSARFMGEYGYFVTFRQLDPLFVVDLSNPAQPVILDELKVTGFSSYLHQWSDNVLLGVGREADEDGREIGVKISLFDISDKTNISETSKTVLQYAYSYDTYIYKNMMVAPEKSLFGMNIYLRGEEGTTDDYVRYLMPYYCVYQYQDGEFVSVLQYKLEQEESDYDGYEYRGLYIGDYLYIVTMNQGVVAVNLNDYSVGEFVAFT